MNNVMMKSMSASPGNRIIITESLHDNILTVTAIIDSAAVAIAWNETQLALRE